MLRDKPIKTNLWFYVRYIIRLSLKTSKKIQFITMEETLI